MRDEADQRVAPTDEVAALIFCVGLHRVILDADLARLYGVTTKALNQAVKRNRERFPADFAFRLGATKAAAPKRADDLQVLDALHFGKNRSRIVTGSQKHRDRRFPPLVFTEHGVLMAANVVRSDAAARMSIFVIRAFVRLREQASTNSAILRRLAEIDKTLMGHDRALRDLYQKLLPLLQPPADPPRRGIGFHVDSA